MWQTLKIEGKLPSKWGQRSSYADNLHRNAMKKFRELKYCANDYKRTRFATDRYSGWYRTHGKAVGTPSEAHSDDEVDEDSPTSPIVGRKRSFTMPPPTATSSSHKRARSSAPSTAPRASTAQPTASRHRGLSLAPLARRPASRLVSSLGHDQDEDENEEDEHEGDDTEVNTPTLEHNVVRRSASLNRPGPNQTPVIRLVDLSDPAKRKELQDKLRKVGDPCARVPRAPMPTPPASVAEDAPLNMQGGSSQATGSLAAATGGGDTGGSKLRIAKKSNTARCVRHTTAICLTLLTSP